MKPELPTITNWQSEFQPFLGTEPKTFAECYHRIKQCERSKDLKQLLALQGYLTLLYWEAKAYVMIDDQIKILNSLVTQVASDNEPTKITKLILKFIDTLKTSNIDTTLHECILTKQEAHLIGTLEKHGPQSKFQLIEILFGENIDIFSGENRLKNLLSRIRQKAPDSILFKEGSYYLSKHFKYKTKESLTKIDEIK